MPRAHFDDEGPTEHDEHLLADDANDTVPCPACGKQILAFADRCYRCGEIFGKEAWQVSQTRKQSFWLIVGAVVLIGFIIATLNLL